MPSDGADEVRAGADDRAVVVSHPVVLVVAASAYMAATRSVPLSKWTEKRLRGWLDEFEDALNRHTTSVPLAVGSRYDFSTTTCNWSISDNSGNALASGTYSPPPGVWPNTSEGIPVGRFYIIPTDAIHPDLSELPGPPEN